MAGKVRIYNEIEEDCDLFVCGQQPNQARQIQKSQRAWHDRSGLLRVRPHRARQVWVPKQSVAEQSGSFSGRAFALAIAEEVGGRDDVELYLFPNLWVLNSDRG
jgi:hypothetical protein